MQKKHLKLALIFLFVIYSFSPSGKLPESVITAFKTGNADIIANYFNTVVELNLNGKECNCSRLEAKNQLRQFFSSIVPSNFQIKFEGGKEFSYFAIGTLTANNGLFRVTIKMKEINGTINIQQIKIDKEE